MAIDRVLVRVPGLRPDPVTGATEEEDQPLRPSFEAVLVSLGLLLLALVAAFAIDASDGFVPRVPTIDALAGLAVGAFVVDRLLTFIPPVGAKPRSAAQRSADLNYLRVGFGALLGAMFVVFTDLRAVKALVPDSADGAVAPGKDRAIAVLAIAAGVAGLARLLAGLNPQKETRVPDTAGGDPSAGAPNSPAADAERADADPDPADTLPPPSREAYLIGWGSLAVAALLAIVATSKDIKPLELLGSESQSQAGPVATGGTVALVVRFGTVILLAGIVEQVVERVVSPLVLAKQNKKLITGGVAVVLGVAAALIVQLFLLHNIGFFGVGNEPLSDALDRSSGLERWFDALMTGVAIAAGTKPLHDLSARLRKRAATDTRATSKATKTATTTTPPTSA